ncbi:MAG TPA: ABC transporter ATP-binding protein [Thermodesulfobacteriota bacterium]|nr:ABC transporter ATP-binding protein [Thermodesulfobacteriota bacterium]
MLRVENLSIFYGRIRALHNFTLHVEPREVVALIGANGAGKSTIINAISGLISPAEGEIHFGGERIDGAPPEMIVGRGLIQVAEGRELFPTLTVMENLSMGAYTVREKRKIEESQEKVFHLFPILQERRKNLAQTLSGGEQQMLAVGRALMSNPRMIMLDEPSFGLAPILVDRIFEVITRLNKETGLPILLVEQNVFLSLRVSSRGYVIERGKKILEGESEALLHNPGVEKAYLGV